ncbi:MAG: hypothetical protein LBG28_08025 [Tannerella sp.]|jgi:hypothetical protein|nr:hypothetical protein [Tannerella sp.]
MSLFQMQLAQEQIPYFLSENPRWSGLLIVAAGILLLQTAMYGWNWLLTYY